MLISVLLTDLIITLSKLPGTINKHSKKLVVLLLLIIIIIYDIIRSEFERYMWGQNMRGTEELIFQVFWRINSFFFPRWRGEEEHSWIPHVFLPKFDLFSKCQWAYSYSTEKMFLNWPCPQKLINQQVIEHQICEICR